MYSAKIVEDSVSDFRDFKTVFKHKGDGHRLTTMQLVYPRFIHSEFLTHRAFSRNASSSRAIPVSKMLKQIRENPAMPISWGKNQPGMQAGEEHDVLVSIKHRLPATSSMAGGEATVYYDSREDMTAQEAWRFAANQAADTAEAMMNAGYHKQIVNRLTETYQWIHVVVSATDWDNFFALRDHKDAQPEIQHLAQLMRKAMDESIPQKKAFQEWHLPYVSDVEKASLSLVIQKKISTARCARVSYLTHSGSTPDVQKDCDLHDKLVGSKPIHASPTEHQAMAVNGWSKNFRGWKQYRHEVEQFLK